ncbi:MAG: hypothetical protein M1816_000853 [Peltula sp. TS41687]|nr:MAG: hypothetical protein M1816_000853 [Peltula sp. TS41687]
MIRPLFAALLVLLAQSVTPLSLPGPHPPTTAYRMHTARQVIQQLKLTPHPESGYYIQTFEDPDKVDGRSPCTAIYYLLERGQLSNWHRVLDATEIWHYYAGAPLMLSLSNDDGNPVRNQVLGPNIFNHQSPQIIINKAEWQRAESMGDWTLVGTTVAPGFTFEGFEMAKPGWTPRGASGS